MAYDIHVTEAFEADLIATIDYLTVQLADRLVVDWENGRGPDVG